MLFFRSRQQRHRMSKHPIRLCFILLWFWIAGLPAGGHGTDLPPSANQEEMETTVLHVDKYAVYGPNLIFYWDPGMSKQKIGALTSAAERLRNKKARITYRVREDAPKRSRFILMDIAAAPKESKPSTEAPQAKAPSEERSRMGPRGEPDSDLDREEGPASLEPEPDLPLFDDEETPRTTFLPVTISRKEILRFIEKCMDANTRKNLDGALACYDHEVDYYGKGKVDKEFIRKDKGYYFRQWDTISSSIEGDVVIIVTDEPGVQIAKFVSLFEVTKGSKTVRGRAENLWKILKVDGQLKIMDEKQRILPPR